MARTQAENYDEIRQGILRRSATVFAGQGYANTSIADLARANGISRGLLYHYFASKEALLSEMLHEHLDMMLAAVRRAAAGEGGAEMRFRDTVRTFVRINAASKDLQVTLLHDLQNLAEDDRAAIEAKQRDILAVVRDLIAACDPAAGRDRRTLSARTMMLVGMINYTYIWYDPSGPVGPEEYADMAADTWLKGRGAG
ncbi:TetR/AcrR family transcriptional regulator [Minwuia thermotolerans]|nr:TetR/AcrR family transcriptional regulator [Minwuia thermotolerans]